MKPEEDYYKILGVDRNATEEQIKDAFAKRAKETHPDINQEPGATEKFQAVNKAYETLRDPSKRRMYDQFGSDANRYNYQGGHPGQGGNFGNFNTADFDDIIRHFNAQSGGFNAQGSADDLFSRIHKILYGTGSSQNSESPFQRSSGTQNTGGQYSPHVQVETLLSFNDVVHGVKKTIEYNIFTFCDNCKGSGADKPSDLVKCSTCKGHGVVIQTHAIFRFQSTCPTCHGQGQSVKTQCHKCVGKGVIVKKTSVTLNIPKGIHNETHINFPNHGNYVSPTQRGSLILRCLVKPSPIFIRKGNDLVINVPVKYFDALLGTTVSIPSLSGEISKIKIPPNTKDNALFRLKNRGLPVMNRPKLTGDMIINVKIVSDPVISAKEKTLLKKIKAANDPEFYQKWLIDQLEKQKK